MRLSERIRTFKLKDPVFLLVFGGATVGYGIQYSNLAALGAGCAALLGAFALAVAAADNS